jgi:hypothetical protein
MRQTYSSEECFADTDVPKCTRLGANGLTPEPQHLINLPPSQFKASRLPPPTWRVYLHTTITSLSLLTTELSNQTLQPVRDVGSSTTLIMYGPPIRIVGSHTMRILLSLLYIVFVNLAMHLANLASHTRSARTVGVAKRAVVSMNNSSLGKRSSNRYRFAGFVNYQHFARSTSQLAAYVQGLHGRSHGNPTMV